MDSFRCFARATDAALYETESLRMQRLAPLAHLDQWISNRRLMIVMRAGAPGVRSLG